MHRSAFLPDYRHRRRLISGLIACLSLVALGTQGQVLRKPVIQKAPPPTAPTPAPNFHSEVYTDREGAKHPWTVTAAHSLLWDGVPYMPVGGAFTPHSLADSADSAWQDDVRVLTTLREKGMLDLLIAPAKALPDIPASAFQRLVDYLDTNGFRYGLAFGPGVTRPLTGTVVKPANYRFFEPDAVTAHWRASNADQGLVTILEDSNSGDYHVVQVTRYPIKDDFLSVPLEPGKTSGKLIGLLYPHKTLPTTAEGACPDLWSGYDDYRDRLLAYMGGIKFGKGLRFLLDPLARHLGLAGEYENLIPESEGFRLEWESWLERTYAGVEDVRSRWSLTEHEPKSYDELARYVPLWLGDRGLGYLYDPKGDQIIRVDSTKSTFWNDFRQFRNESIANYMRSLAEVLKHQVVDVPVVYTWTQNHPIFLNAEVEGFDGLSVATHGRPSVAGQLGPALSAIEQSARPMWYLAAEVSPDVPVPGAVSPDPPAGTAATATRVALFSVLDEIKRTGVKGFFAGSTAPDTAKASWLTAPDRAEWLHEYATQLGAQPTAAPYLPKILFFPQDAPGPAHVGPIPGVPNVLWLSSQADGEALDFWPAFSGYILKADETHQETVLISNKGPRVVHCTVPDNRFIQAFTADGTPVPVKLINKNAFTVRLDSTPTVIRTGAQRIILQEPAEDALAQLEALMVQAATSKSPEVQNVKASLFRAQDDYVRKNYDASYLFARDGLNQMMDIVKPYIWMEGEAISSKTHTFDEIAIHPEVSGERYLRLSNPNPPSKFGYGAHWEFDVASDGRYNVWMAGSVPAPYISPIRWAIDAAPNLDPADLKPHGPLYAGDQFGWILLGAVNVKKGRHVLEIEVIDHAVSPAIYNFAVDAFVLSKNTFVPNATLRPVPIENAVMGALPNFKKRTKK
jgi:hypothetical protein